MKPIRILYVDDYPLDRELVRDALEKEHGGFEVVEAASRADFETALAQGGFDLILSDFNILGFEGLQVLDAVHTISSRLPVILVTGTGSEEVAAEAIKRGAADYVIKTPKHIQRLPHTVYAVLEKKRLEDERQQIEEALRASEARYRALFENVGEGIGLVDSEERFTFANPAAEALFGVPSGKLAGRELQEFMTPQQFAAIREQTGRRRAGVKSVYETEIRRPNGEKRNLLVTGSPEFNNQGQFEGTFGVFRDITERKQAEEKIRAMNAELEQRVEERTRELRAAQEQLIQQERLAVLGRLAGGVSQELRNPLGIINNAIYYLRLVQPDAEAKIKEYLGIIEQEAHNADEIVSDLLDFSNPKLADVEPVTVSDLVRSTLERFPVPENMHVTLNLSENLPLVYVDPRQMTQVLGNLVVNACQAMKEGGRLTVDGRQLTVDGQSSVVIAIKDTGSGITPENMKKLFEPLFTTKPKGIGLGLAVSKRLIEANGGRIEVESEVGKGCAFTLYLPVKAQMDNR